MVKEETNYTNITDPFNNQLRRVSSEGQFKAEATEGIGSPNQVKGNVISGGAIDDMRITNWIKSENFKPGVTGFLIDGMTGNVEFGDGKFRGDITGASGTFSGTITATIGSIGGWTISSNAIYLDGATNDVSSGMASGDYPFYAGKKYTDRATAPFRVTPAGALFASSATITGILTAGSGSDIDFDYVSGGTKPDDNADVTGSHTANDTSNVDGKSAGGFSTVVDDGATPAEPTGLTASAGIQGVFLKWTYNIETDMSHYEIWRNTSDDNSTASKIGQVKTNLFWDSDLTSGTTYYYWIKAVDHLGNTSGFNATAGTTATPRNVGESDVDDNAITAGKINVVNLAAINADLGAITAGSIDAARIISGELPVDRTEAKCTDPNADQTSANTAADTNKVQGYTLISGGYIATGRITCDNINTGTLTGRTVRTDTDSYPDAQMDSNGVTIAGQSLTFVTKSSGLSAGWISGEGQDLTLTSYPGDLILSSNDNIRLHPSNFIYVNSAILPETAYQETVGNSSYPFASMCATTYYFKSSASSLQYIQINSSSGIDVNTDFYVGGTLSKSGGSFKIDHPLKPKTHWLEHSFVECPDMLNLYVGKAEIINGEYKIKMPDWFIPLNGKNKEDYTYQLTSIGQFNNLMVKQKINDKGEIIFAGEKDGKFSYMITAIRHDKWAEKHRIKVESKK